MLKFTQRQVQIPIGFIWFVFAYGLFVGTINTADTWQFNLQHIGIEALAERGTWYFEGSKHPHMQPQGDIFYYKGHTYVCKQPGQIVLGAVIYKALQYLGFSYEENYMLVQLVFP